MDGSEEPMAARILPKHSGAVLCAPVTREEVPVLSANHLKANPNMQMPKAAWNSAEKLPREDCQMVKQSLVEASFPLPECLRKEKELALKSLPTRVVYGDEGTSIQITLLNNFSCLVFPPVS